MPIVKQVPVVQQERKSNADYVRERLGGTVKGEPLSAQQYFAVRKAMIDAKQGKP